MKKIIEVELPEDVWNVLEEYDFHTQETIKYYLYDIYNTLTKCLQNENE